MNESGGDDDPSAEVAGEEVDVKGDLQPSDAHRQDGEEGHRGRDDEDDEESGDASAEPAIIVVGRGVEVAEYLIKISCVKVDSLRVEVVRHCSSSFFLPDD